MSILKSPLTYELPTESYPFRAMTLARNFAQEDSEKVAFRSAENEHEQVTYSQVIRYADSFSGWLQKEGYKKGDIIYLALRNCWQIPVLVIGATQIGVIVTLASPEFTSFEHEYQIDDSMAKLIITEDSIESNVRKGAQKFAPLKILKTRSTIDDIQPIFESNLPFKQVHLDLRKDVMLILYSSGTTGKPKGVMISHFNYSTMLTCYNTKYDFEYKSLGFDGFVPPQTNVTFLPLYHAMGLFTIFSHFTYGTLQLILSKFDLKLYLTTVSKYEVQVITLVPSVVIKLVKSTLLDEIDLSCLLGIGCGSAPLSKSVIDKLREKLPNVIIAQGFGMTELSVASHLGTRDTPDGSVGVLVPNTEMKVLKEDGTLCGPNEEGECWIRGPQIMLGYWRKEKETKELMDKDGFIRTGDIVYYDKDGYTWVSDRIKELIKVHGKQVAPAELESILLNHPMVDDACVIGIAHEDAGEVPRAYVVAKNGAKPEDILNFMNEKVAPYKRLKGGIEFLPVLPRTNTGKLLRRQLKLDYTKKSNL
ncbi:hypothetical protein WR25_20856 [Diploscapter pachys]|uniref:AMP-dependent synthetase/ligase domain-containing protein n=1 Tax=Diploscapter pachys TaxID=2018661 RepID=A0A2A2JPN1_9BILA|nr:hypothetical protein WR25_20856 [Diploscapter pachys]